MKRVAIYSKENERCLETENILSNLLIKEGFILDKNNPEIVIAIGGDGTFLRAIHHYLSLDNIIFTSVNAGHLGFFSEFEPEEVELLVKVLKDDNYSIKKHRLINAIISSSDESQSIYALNEIRIENPFHTLIADVSINNDNLETFRGNGLVVCSSIGSSAYNKSLGGAVVDVDLEVLELTEIAAIQNNFYRSLDASYIASGDSIITFSGNFNEVVVGYDYETFHLAKASKIDLSLSKKTISLLKYKKITHIKKLKDSFIE